jgi:hypothetical protein
LADLQRAARLYPYDHEYRLGPARLIIRDNVWYDPAFAIELLESVKKNDPNSHYLQAWIDAFQERQKIRP